MQRNRLLKYLLVVLALTAFLHFIVLPAASGGYNDECFIPDEKRRILRTMVQNISKVFDKYDVKYWLDYGTLLGAYRMGDVLPHDHDADMSFLVTSNISQAFQELAKSGIAAAGIKARFNGVILDFVPWKPQYRTTHERTQLMLYKSYPSYVLENDNIMNRYHHKLETFPYSWAFPAGRINFHGVSASVPHSPEKLLSFRYPYTFGLFGVRMQTPYKWKCYIPCWLRKSNGC